MCAAPNARESERRLRIFVELRLRFILLDGSLTGPAFVSALSESDLFVETDHPLPIGALVRMRLYIPGEAAVDVRGFVRRHGEGKQMLGMRIEFVELDPDAHDAVARYLEPSRRTIRGKLNGSPRPVAPPTGEAAPAEPADEIPLSERFDPEALQLFVSMHGKMLQFFETLDTATARALLGESPRPIDSAEPAKIPAPFEAVSPELFDPELAGEDSLPLVAGVLGSPAELVDEAARIREKYALDDSVFDVTGFKSKYSISDDLFGEEGSPSSPIPPWPDAGKPAQTTPPRVDHVVSKMNESKEHRQACAKELRKRGEEALARGLVLKAASELGLAIAFDSADETLRSLYEKVRAQANAVRAEESYQQALQQSALGDTAAASRLLLAVTQLSDERKYVLAAAKLQFRLHTTESLREARSLLRGALDRSPNDADLHFLCGKTAEAEGFAKIAARSYARVLELAPDHTAAREALARLEEEKR